VRAIIYTRMKT